MIPYLFNKLQKSKWEGLWNLAEIEITKRYGKVSNSANMDRPCCQVWKITRSFSNHNFSHFKRVTTHYQTLQTSIGLNVTRYHNFNALPHALTHALPYIFFEICLVLGCFRYHHFFKKNINMHVYIINLTVTRCKQPQIMLHWQKMYSNVWDNTLKLWKHVALWPFHVKLRENVW